MPWKCCLVTPSGTSQCLTVEMGQPLSPLSHVRKFCVHRPHSPAPSSRQPGCDDHSCTELIRYHPRHQSQTYSVHIVAQACDPCTREAEAGESRVGGQIGSHSEILSFLSTLLLPALARPGGHFRHLSHLTERATDWICITA